MKTSVTVTLAGILERAKVFHARDSNDALDAWYALDRALDEVHHQIDGLDEAATVLLREAGLAFRGDDDGKKTVDWDAVIEKVRRAEA